MRFCGWREVHFSYKMLCVSRTRCTNLGELVTFFAAYIIWETPASWAMHLKLQQSLLCFMLLPQPILGMTAFYLHEQSVTSVKEIKLVKKMFGFFRLFFFFPYDSKQSAVSAISPVLSLSLLGKQLLPLTISCAFLSFISTSVSPA